MDLRMPVMVHDGQCSTGNLFSARPHPAIAHGIWLKSPAVPAVGAYVSKPHRSLNFCDLSPVIFSENFSSSILMP